MNPVCARCQIELRPKHNGTVAVSMAVYGPMEIRRADLWHCPSCHIELLIGFARNPELSQFDPAFQARLDSYDLDQRERVIRYWSDECEKKAAVKATV